MVDIIKYNNLRFEYSIGANVIMFSLIDTSIDKTVLTSNNVSKIIINYSYNDKSYTYETPLKFHINSILGIIKDLPENTNIEFTPYLSYLNEDNLELYRIRITDTIHEKTLPYGNITYNLITTSDTTNDNLVKDKIINILKYINGIGSYVDLSSVKPGVDHARVIPIKFNKNIQTAQATYYNSSNAPHGLVQTSGGTYADNSTIFHELRHRYGIYPHYGGSYLTRDSLDGRSDLFSYIEEKFKIINDAQKFETGREDAKVWIFDAHSNILEGSYTNDGDLNYLAANFIKALIWYTCHETSDEDTSKIRIIAPLNIVLVYEYFIPIETEEENNNHDSFVINSKQEKVIDKIINLGPYKYLCKYYKNGSTFIDNTINHFKLLRNFNIVNNIVYDKDIFFLDSNIYNKYKDNQEENICFPIYNNHTVNFSTSLELFNTYKFTNIDDISYDIYQDTDNSDEKDEANIKCDLIRIYSPTIKKDLDFIIYIDNYINNIHFHYLCNLSSNYVKKCESEIKIGNNTYVEYIDVKIPNIEYLFNSNYYINDDYNIIIESNATSTNEYFNNECTETKSNKMYLDKFIQPYMIKDNSKIFIDNKEFNYNLSYINKNIIKITLYPYSELLNNVYINSTINPVTIFMNNEKYLRLHSNLGFDNNTISIINKFEFPGKLEAEDNYYDIDIYGNYKSDNFEYEDKYYKQVTEYYNSYYLNDNIEYLKDKEDIDDGLDVENIRTTGYIIQIANDLYFQDIIFESVINTDNNNDNFIYDFAFSLDNMVQSWTQLNEILVIRSKFIDKRLNVIITGNNVILTKEWFKYLINDTNINHVSFNIKKENNLISKDFMDINQGYNFIDKINCIVNENSKSQLDIQIQNQNTQIIYKPIFYKVQDLQNLKIKENVIQNIGINLNDYITKVKLFILNINGQNIKESYRNDIYVIFKVNANLIEDYIGTYNILDENFEYISSGNYTLI